MFLIPVLVDGELRYGVHDDDGTIVIGWKPSAPARPESERGLSDAGPVPGACVGRQGRPASHKGGRLGDGSTFAPASRLTSESAAARGTTDAVERSAQPLRAGDASTTSSSRSRESRRPGSGSPPAAPDRGASHSAHASAAQASPRARAPQFAQRQGVRRVGRCSSPAW